MGDVIFPDFSASRPQKDFVALRQARQAALDLEIDELPIGYFAEHCAENFNLGLDAIAKKFGRFNTWKDFPVLRQKKPKYITPVRSSNPDGDLHLVNEGRFRAIAVSDDFLHFIKKVVVAETIEEVLKYGTIYVTGFAAAQDYIGNHTAASQSNYQAVWHNIWPNSNSRLVSRFSMPYRLGSTCMSAIADQQFDYLGPANSPQAISILDPLRPIAVSAVLTKTGF